MSAPAPAQPVAIRSSAPESSYSAPISAGRATAAFSEGALLERARTVLAIEAEAVQGMQASIDADFVKACEIILSCSGRLVVSGIGKSGHIARKLASTFASTGTLSFFVHPAEASHGDLGMVAAEDVFLCLSNSGTTEELLRIVPLIKRQGARLIAMTGQRESPLAKLADVHLSTAVEREACPMNLAPTASTTATLALGDALAVAVLEARNFSPDDFARSHPGGALGRRLLTLVRDIMHTGDELPHVRPDAPLTEAIVEMTHKRLGITGVTSADGRIAGALTDGDLRRLLLSGRDIRALRVDDVMTPSPIRVHEDMLAAEAVNLMEQRRIGQLLVVDGNDRLTGALNFQDMLVARVV